MDASGRAAGEPPPRPRPRRHEHQVGRRRARRRDDWRVLDRGPGRDAGRRTGPDAVVARLAEVGAEAIGALPGRRHGRASASPACTTRPPARPGSSSTSRAPGPGDRSRARSATRSGCPPSLINDARAFGLAELRLGAGAGRRSMVGLTLGTGVGGVIAIDGRVHQGHDGTAGELGHQTIDPDGPWCGCGNRGCLEAFARADRIAAACGTATRRGGGRARPGRRRAGDRPGWPRSGATSASGSPT